MCGIAGIVGTVNIDKMISLFLMLQTRGMDATGLAIGEGEAIYVYKKPGPALEVIGDSQFRRLLKEHPHPDYVLLHCRAATHGSPSSNKNNHPIYSKKGLIIHNGIIWSVSKKVEPEGETDTEELLLNIDELGLKNALEQSRGTISIAYVPLSSSGRIWLFTNGNSLYFGEHKQAFFFCSDGRMLSSLDVGNVRPAKTDFLYNYSVPEKKLFKTKNPLNTHHNSWPAYCYNYSDLCPSPQKSIFGNVKYAEFP